MIDEANFPDAAFRQYLLEAHEGTSIGSYGTDGILMKWEIDNITSLDIVYNTQLEDVNLTDCSGLSWNNSLSNFQYQPATTMKVLNLTGCTGMTQLYLNSRFPNLEEITIDRCTGLSSFSYTYASGQSNGQPKKFSAADCSNLNTLNLSNHFGLEEVYVANCSNLYSFSISSQDNSKLKKLSILSCPNVGVNSLPYSSFTGLEELVITNHLNFSGFDENNPFSNGVLKKLVLDGCTGFTQLNMSNNALEEVSFTGCTGLSNLWLRNNQLHTLDLSTNTGVQYCYANNNLLNTVDVTACTALKILELNNNLIEAIDLTNNANLIELYIATNLLSDLDLDYTPNLEKLNCSENFLD